MAIVLDAFASYVGDLLNQVADDELTLLLGVSGEIANLEDRLRSLNDYLADAERRRITDQSVQGWVRKLKDAIRIKALNARLDAICKSASAFSFLKLEAYEDMAAPRRSSAADPRKTDPVLERSAVVGEKIEEDTRALVKRLTNGKKQSADKAMIEVVAVVGTGGIGKTTLAKKVFNDEGIQEAFDKKIWLSVTQDVNEVELLRTAIKSAGGTGGGTRDSNKSLLVPALVDAIRDKRFLLVLDDVWSDRGWNGLLKAPFSHGAAGSRVLLTTRHETVARGMQATHPFHHVDALCPEDAWSLLKKQVNYLFIVILFRELEIDDTLKDLGMEIADKCGGLPLAIKCFLHYSLLPKNVEFFIDTVVSMWISEGFLHGETDDLEQLGEECYKELIYRNLIEPDTDYAGQLKHLRYISLKCGDITRLPENIGKMRFLQYLGLVCENLERLPNSIVKLGQLRYLDLSATSITSIPRRFCGLTSLRTLYGFPTQVDGEWCSLQELGALAQLQVLGLSNLENVPAISFAAKARLGDKSHLSYLILQCTSILGEDGLVEDEGVSEEEHQRIEEVLDELTPPLCLENIELIGYFGDRLPRWMMSGAASAYERLSIVIMEDLACCTQLPDGLCSLPSLQYFQVNRAPAIKRVGSEFMMMQPSLSQRRHAHAFPRLKTMNLRDMVEWEEWEWEQMNNVHAMPSLEELLLENCKLRRLPPGLSLQAKALTSMYLYNMQQLNSIDSFASLVKLELYDNTNLERVASLPRLQKLEIVRCPKIRALEELPELNRLELQDLDMQEFPGYLLQGVCPRNLVLDCNLELLTVIAMGESGPEWGKLSHVQHVKAYADQGDNERKWHVLYMRDPYSFETNIGNGSSSNSRAIEDDVE
ncbi:probable disease resistance protein At1g58602 [Oryza brachyantha]|uniref:probable disease resistance protein At1g58602 n=1 Tax=Oryza brachyantha TaxID=4533 RepID=UPI001ADAB425|nr:probable disease resistance protein At1g58602 [Oryza brachyantha]